MKSKTIQITTALSLSLLFLVGCDSGTETTLTTEQSTMEMSSSALDEIKNDVTNEVKEHADTVIDKE